MFDLKASYDMFLGILGVLPTTLLLAITILVLSTLLGVVIALIQQYKIPVLVQLIGLFKLFLRGTPMVVFLYLMYYALPAMGQLIVSLLGIDYNMNNLSPVIILVVTVSLTLSTFQSEIIRGSFLAVDYGQIEAAHSLGYSFFQTFKRIIAPQAFVHAVPDFANSFTVAIKATSLGFLITVIDIFAQAKIMAAQNFRFIEAFLMVALIYWGIGILITKFADRYENDVRIK
ncbi:amino acid ABC transporter permease [Sporosarcina sp. JAI121]|uniref:amino acid ABC transporter permease n=1 Tax=Sporosarcina sp. JAI121 TaxID=2723064 RepID=UPI0015CDB9D8|nr:amino acid ABC transporter permease [Sporosarcina sp. JAI121]NYF23656.1 His/Glu/Gln/Arg/opine family amino acid ABC transporter permease subunit [Sporosarcina sp. JAI121]